MFPQCHVDCDHRHVFYLLLAHFGQSGDISFTVFHRSPCPVRRSKCTLFDFHLYFEPMSVFTVGHACDPSLAFKGSGFRDYACGLNSGCEQGCNTAYLKQNAACIFIICLPIHVWSRSILVMTLFLHICVSCTMSNCACPHKHSLLTWRFCEAFFHMQTRILISLISKHLIHAVPLLRCKTVCCFLP